jgi:hypothetical protein
MLLEVWMPKDAPAGLYKGTVSVTKGGAEVEKLSLELTVLDLTLPDQPTFAFDEPQGGRGRIDFDFKSGIEFEGRSPSLYTFYGDDLLMVVYPEGVKGPGVKNPDLRQPPPQFGSDGDRNMWILRRVTDEKK